MVQLRKRARGSNCRLLLPLIAGGREESRLQGKKGFGWRERTKGRTLGVVVAVAIAAARPMADSHRKPPSTIVGGGGRKEKRGFGTPVLQAK